MRERSTGRSGPSSSQGMQEKTDDFEVRTASVSSSYSFSDESQDEGS